MSTDTTDTVVTLTSDRIDLLRRRVRAGAEMLDTKLPGWWENINFDQLDIRDGWDCILGQLYDTYRDGCAELGLNRTGEDSEASTRLYGFNISGVELHALYGPSGHENDHSVYYSAINAEATALKDLWMAAVRTRAADTA